MARGSGHGSGGGRARGERRTGAAQEKRWGGRFEKRTNPLVEEYTSSIQNDAVLIPYDIQGSIAHVRMLGQREIIDARDARANLDALERIQADAEAGRFVLRPEHEDVHMNIEAELERRIGRPAGRLHTARSRNDQVATDFRLCVMEFAGQLSMLLVSLQRVLVDLAEQHVDTVMPGYTHLQLAQPVVLGHHLLAYREMFHRDELRFLNVASSAAVSPLGSGALAGLPYPIDRQMTADELGFDAISANSMDAVSDRDFVIEFHTAASICMMHVSRLAEELILWSTREFGFITLDDAFATGSSIMPQKKNPDVAELARGRTGTVYGNLTNALTMMKGLPLTYNRDLQEDKQPVFSTMYVLSSTLTVFAAMLPTITWHKERLRQAAAAGYSLATDIADYLVRKGLPFREAHEVVGRLVRWAESESKDFADLTLGDYLNFSPLFDESVLTLDLEAAIDARDVPGGTARNRVREQIGAAREWFRTVEEEIGLEGEEFQWSDGQPGGR